MCSQGVWLLVLSGGSRVGGRCMRCGTHSKFHVARAGDDAGGGFGGVAGEFGEDVGVGVGGDGDGGVSEEVLDDFEVGAGGDTGNQQCSDVVE